VSTPASDAIRSTSQPNPSRAATGLAWLLLAITAGALALRIPSIAEPLGIDQSLWASAVRAMSHGARLYHDVWEQRPPGIYLIYLTGFRMLGWSTATVAWLDILAAVLTTVLLYLIARRLGGRLTAATTAALYAALTMPAWLYKDDAFLWRSVCETFTPIGVATAALACARLRDRPSVVVAAVAGLALGSTVVLKPNAGLYAPAIIAWMLFSEPSASPRSVQHPSLTATAVWIVAACSLLPALTMLWLWQIGVLADARVAVVEFNRWYVSNGFTVSGMLLAFSKAVWLRMKTEPLWLAGGIGSLAVAWDLARRRPLAPLASLAVAWGAAAACVIAVNGIQLFNSYFIQALPPLALLSGWLITRGGPRSLGRTLVAASTVALMLMLLQQRSYVPKVIDAARLGLDRLQGRITESDYLERFGDYGQPRGYSARANAELAAYVQAHTKPNDRVFLFGINGAGVYFLADRMPAHRFLRVNFFVATDFPDPAFRLDAVVRDLEVRRPLYVIFERLHSASVMGVAVDALGETPEVRRLLEHYALETTIEDFTVWRLKD